MKIFSTVNISKLNFLLIICIAKNLNFIGDYLDLCIFCTRFQILSDHNKPHISGKLFIQHSDLENLTLKETVHPKMKFSHHVLILE